MANPTPPDDLTEIAVILDRSGSMMSSKDDMEGGLWALISEQHGLPGRCRVSMYHFDHEWDVVFEGKPSGEITSADCRLEPRGNTALHDAVVRSLGAIEARVLGEPEEERPAKIVAVVITDGRENASFENKKKDSHGAIGRVTEKYGWQFVFLGCDPEGFQDGVDMTAGRVGTSVAAYDAGDVRGAYVGTSRALADYRSGRTAGVNLDLSSDGNSKPEPDSDPDLQVH